jgi:tellurite resistance protein TehA-like permease
MVMATGIISIGLKNLHYMQLASLFKAFALVAWLVLVLLCTIRVLRYYRAVFIDLTAPRMVFSYFTLVAATDIVGMLLHDSGYPLLALACWILSFVVWCLLLYMAFSVLTFLSHENNVNIMHGGWLITIVGTQSLVLLGTAIAPDLGEYTHIMMVEVHMLWGLGLSLYGIFVALFCYRIFFLSLKPQDLSPLLWVVMGAAAISSNAGTSLFWSNDQLPFLAAQKPFIDGVTLMIWSWASWWIPMLFLFGLWKHAINKIPFKYEPALWSMVFPLGMYATASERLGQAAEFPPMTWIAQLMIWVAITAWVLVLAGMLKQMLQLQRPNDTELNRNSDGPLV